MEDFDKALENYKIAFKGGITKAADDIASLYLQQQDYNQADKWLWKAIKPLRVPLENNPYQLDDKQIATIKKLATIDEQQFATLKKSLIVNDKQYDTLKKLVYVYLKKEQYVDAYRWLGLGQAWTKNDKVKQSTILKYLGWIRLKKEDYKDAKTQLQHAIFLDYKQASAHCLLAQALEELKEQKNAKVEWEQCLAYANREEPDEDAWIDLARQRLATKGEQ